MTRLVLGILVLASAVPARANAPSPLPSLKSIVTQPAGHSAPVPAASGVPNPAAAPDAAPTPTALTEGESRSLMREFVKAQRSELKGLEHRQKFEMQELKQTQKVARKEWEAQEKAARHKFFADNAKGPDRRTYVKDFIARRKTLMTEQKAAMAERKKAHSEALAALKTAQVQRLKEVEAMLAKKERPPESMWPARSQ